MIISRIDIDEGVYYNLHAEEVVTSNFLADDNSGVYVDRLQIRTINRVFDDIKSHEKKNIILDFSKIVACQPNLRDRLIQLKKDGYLMLFINLLESLCEELQLSIMDNPLNKKEDALYQKFYLFEDQGHACLDGEFLPSRIFESEFKRRIKGYIAHHVQPHTSSFIYLSTFVDMKKFISYENSFLIFSLYTLAIKVTSIWKSELTGDPILICQSLNSSYLASVLSTLLKLDILILDQVGPVNKLYNRIEKNISSKRKYIIVSDMVCLGTEVKIVKNIVHFMGGKCLGNIAIIKTETLKKSDIKRKDATVAVFSIKRENNKELNFGIKTDLESLE